MARRISASVRPYVLPEKDRHLVSRFSCGPNEELVTTVRGLGGSEAWFVQQLEAVTAADDPAEASAAWWPRLRHAPATAWEQVRTEKSSAWEYGSALIQHSLAYKILTPWQTREVMHDFWMNLLYVPACEDRSFPWRFRYEQMMRARALTSFRGLLRAAVVHPAMSGWLTNYDNTKDGINENLGRELLELFTVGRPAGYDEDDVKSCARLLTGFRVKVFDTFESSYDPARHWTGRVDVLDFSHGNKNPDGRAAVNALLDHLALHEATAERISRRLCVRFVSDDPSPHLVRTVTDAYRTSRSDVRATLQALRTHPEFLATRRGRLRSPVEDVVATVRAVGARPTGASVDGALARDLQWIVSRMGQDQYRWPRPDGFPESAATWSSPARMLAAWEMHYAFAGSWWGTKDQTRPKPAALLPTTFPLTLADLVEHQSRLLLGRASDPTTLTAVSTMLNRPATYTFKDAAAVDSWVLTVVRGTVLNCPEGMLR